MKSQLMMASIVVGMTMMAGGWTGARMPSLTPRPLTKGARTGLRMESLRESPTDETHRTETVETKSRSAVSQTTPSPTRTVLSAVAKPKIVSPKLLPSRYTGYSEVLASVGHYMANRSATPLYLPKNLNGSVDGPLEVMFHVGNGYTLNLGEGSALPANSPSIAYGQHHFLGEIEGMPAAIPFHARDIVMPLYPNFPTVTPENVLLMPGIRATTYETQSGNWLTWSEDGWTMNLIAMGESWGASLDAARQEALTLKGLSLPGHDGHASFALGTDKPSEASYIMGNSRYFIYDTHFNAVQLAHLMTPVGS